MLFQARPTKLKRKGQCNVKPNQPIESKSKGRYNMILSPTKYNTRKNITQKKREIENNEQHFLQNAKYVIFK